MHTCIRNICTNQAASFDVHFHVPSFLLLPKAYCCEQKHSQHINYKSQYKHLMEYQQFKKLHFFLLTLSFPNLWAIEGIICLFLRHCCKYCGPFWWNLIAWWESLFGLVSPLHIHIEQNIYIWYGSNLLCGMKEKKKKQSKASLTALQSISLLTQTVKRTQATNSMNQNKIRQLAYACGSKLSSVKWKVQLAPENWLLNLLNRLLVTQLPQDYTEKEYSTQVNNGARKGFQRTSAFGVFSPLAARCHYISPSP